MANICLHCFVAGRVQGVFYRRNTVEEAIARGITGWVKNLSDGRVEVMICGEREAVFALRDWLWKGLERAQVESVEAQEAPFQVYSEFKTIH
jgi:acylphosphatase